MKFNKFFKKLADMMLDNVTPLMLQQLPSQRASTYIANRPHREHIIKKLMQGEISHCFRDARCPATYGAAIQLLILSKL